MQSKDLKFDEPKFESKAFQLTDEEEKICKKARELGSEKFAPRAYQYDDEAKYPTENYKGVNEQTAAQIAESRQFRIALRTAMVTPAQEEVNKTYYPPIETSVQSVSPTEVYIRIEYYAMGDDPDGLVEVLKALVEHWDEEYEIHEVVKKTFIWAARQAKVANQAAPGELSLEEQRLFDVEDSKQVQIWKKFCENRCEYFISSFPSVFNLSKEIGKQKTVDKLFIKHDLHYNYVGNEVLYLDFLKIFNKKY